MGRERLRRGARHEPPPGVADALDPPRGVVELLLRERQRLPVVALGEVHQQRVAADQVEHVRQRADVADRLGHLPAQLEHPVVHPDPGELVPARRARLRGLVLVVREDQVVAAAVDLERRPERGLGHGGALDVPAGAPLAPRGGPPRVLHRLARLPQREVERVLLERRALEPLALVHLVDVAVRQLAVRRERADAEVDVALHRVRVAALDQLGDQLDDLVDHQRGLRLVVRPPDPQPVGVGQVVRGHLRGQLGRRPAGGPCGVVDLVVDVGDVGDERRLVALVREEALEQPEDDERARVADVDAAVDGRPARVDAHLAALARPQLGQLAGSRVMQADGAH
jgi:hypothetical protein